MPYVIAIMPAAVPEAAFRKWPPHITLSPIFKWPNQLQKLFGQLEKITKAYPEFRVEVGSRAMFGPRSGVPVLEILPSRALKGLHRDIYRVVGDYQVKPGRYWLDNYRPHITIRDKSVSSQVETGDQLTIKGFHLFEYLNTTDKTKISRSEFWLGS